nr:protein argonaute 10-like [Arachis hypogaea]
MDKSLKDIEDETTTLKEMQAKVKKEMGSVQDLETASTSQVNREEIDSRSIFVGNISSIRKWNLVFAARPGYGHLGTKCVVKANHFLADISASDLGHYTVKIIPEVRCRKTSKAIIAELVRVHKNTELGMRLPVYDGGRNLYTAAMLPFTYKEFTILLIEDDESIGTTREREFKVVIKFAAHVSMHQLRELLSGKQVDTPQEALIVIDIVLRELAAQSYVSDWEVSVLQLSCAKADSTPSKKPKPKLSPAQALGTPAKKKSLAMMSPSSSINSSGGEDTKGSTKC